MPRRLVLAAVLAAGSACAQDCAGTWAGTVGGAPAMLQFNWAGLGSYYLGTAFTGAVLRPREEGTPDWDEFDGQGQRTAALHLACSGEALAGERTAADGRRAAVQARRAEDNTYNRRRLAAAELVGLRAVPENGRLLEVVAVRGFPQLATVRIGQPRAGEVAVNRRLREALLQQLDNHLQCQDWLRARGRFAPAGGDHLAPQRLDWRGTILSVQLWLHGDCGGNGGYAGLQQFTFDTASGQELPLAQWLRPEYRDGIAVDTPLHQALVLPQILRGRKALEELPQARRDCAEFELAGNAAPLAVEERGMLFGFQYSAAMASCGLSFVVPWPRLADFLSDDGRRWREAMQAARQR